jgi:hypothetical protein
MINGPGDMLYRSWWMLLKFYADKSEEADNFEFLNKVQNEISGTLNTKLVDVLLRFPTNIWVSHADRPSNDYDHWEIAWGEVFNGKLETDWVFEDGRRFGSRTESRWQIEGNEDALQSFLIGLHAEAGHKERWNYGVPLTAKGDRQGRTWLKRYEGLEDLLWWRMLFGTDRGLGSLVSLSI